jgi:hypothetical protein
MDVFEVIAKIWPSGDSLYLGTDSSTYTVSYSPTRTAAQFALSEDGTQNYEFLFWNTGRHTTPKRMVHWTINNPGWGTWTATKWYGIPPSGPGGGPARVRADAFSMRSNAPLAATPIDPSSTYAAGAWPSGGDDHVISTVGGAANVVAKDPYPGSGSTTYDFAGWLRLVWGGDPTGVFEENDSGTTGTSPDSTGYFEHFPAAPFAVAMGASADVVAAYGTYHSGGGIGRGPIDWRELLDWWRQRGPDIPQRGDPSPIDFIRLQILENLIPQSRPGVDPGTDFQRVIEAAPAMDREALKRAVQSIKTTLDMGNAALKTVEARLKSFGK